MRSTKSTSFTQMRSKSVSKLHEKINLAKGLDQESNKLLIASIRKNILSLEFSSEHS